MSSTILSLVQQAVSGIGFGAPTSIISSTDQNQIQLRALVYEESRYLRSQKIFPQCKKSFSFTTTSGRFQYPMPQDFYGALLGTQWNSNNRWAMVGPLSDAQFTYRLYGYVTFETRLAYRIFGPDMNPNTSGGQFQVDPPPGTGETIIFEYITGTMFLPLFWVPAAASGLLLSYVSASGNIYQVTTAGTYSSTPPTHTSGQAFNGTAVLLYVGSAYESIVADTDMSIFDDDVMIAGIKYRYQEQKGIDSSSAKAEHDSLIDTAKARWMSSYKINLAETEFTIPRPNLPLGGWGV